MSQPALRARIVLRPRSLDEVFDLALAYLRAHARELRGVLLWATLAPWVLALVTARLAPVSGAETRTAGALLVLFAACAVGERVVTQVVGRHLFERPFRLRDAWGRAFAHPQRWLVGPVLLWVPVALIIQSSLDPGLVALGVMLWLSVGGLIAAFRLRALHLQEVELLERLRDRALRRRSHQLAGVRQGRSMGFAFQALLLRALFVAATAGAASTVLDVLLQFENVSQVLAPVGVLGYALAGPYLAVARLFDYVDARTRGEGWDLQVRFQDIAERDRLERERRAA
jgi:hypothetical protein